MDDAALVLAARGGDRAALGAIYDRYADRLHDYCVTVLRDRHEAADALQDTFVVALRRLGTLRDPAKLRPWLYAIARHEALRRATTRGRVDLLDTTAGAAGMTGGGPDGGRPPWGPPGTNPEASSGAEADEVRRLVWDAAAGLSERDRALLDLHLRQGLDGADLGDAIGVPAAHAYVLLSRLRDQVERSIGALLIARRGSQDCDELRAVLAGWDGTFSPLVRKRVARHVDRCDTCGEARRRMVSPVALLAAVPLVPAPLALRDRVLARLDADLTASHAAPGAGGADAGGGGNAGGAGRWRADGFPPATDLAGLAVRAAVRWLSLAAVALPVLGLLAVAFAVVTGSGGASGTVAVAATSTLPVTAAGPGATVATSTTATTPAPSTAAAASTAPVATTLASATTPGGPATSPATTAGATTTAAGNATDDTDATAPPATTAPPPTTAAPTTPAPTTTQLVTTTTAPPTTTTAPDSTPPALSGATVTPGAVSEDTAQCAAAPHVMIVSVVATDASGIGAVVLSWSTSLASGSVVMTAVSGSAYQAQLSFKDGSTDNSRPGNVSLSITAVDAAGVVNETALSAQLYDC